MPLELRKKLRMLIWLLLQLIKRIPFQLVLELLPVRLLGMLILLMKELLMVQLLEMLHIRTSQLLMIVLLLVLIRRLVVLLLLVILVILGRIMMMSVRVRLGRLLSRPLPPLYTRWHLLTSPFFIPLLVLIDLGWLALYPLLLPLMLPLILSFFPFTITQYF